jgi:hypothetical protein
VGAPDCCQDYPLALVLVKSDRSRLTQQRLPADEDSEYWSGLFCGSALIRARRLGSYSAVSGEGSEASGARALSAGARVTWRKPFTPSTSERAPHPASRQRCVKPNPLPSILGPLRAHKDIHELAPREIFALIPNASRGKFIVSMAPWAYDVREESKLAILVRIDI